MHIKSYEFMPNHSSQLFLLDSYQTNKQGCFHDCDILNGHFPHHRLWQSGIRYGRFLNNQREHTESTGARTHTRMTKHVKNVKSPETISPGFLLPRCPCRCRTARAHQSSPCSWQTALQPSWVTWRSRCTASVLHGQFSSCFKKFVVALEHH